MALQVVDDVAIDDGRDIRLPVPWVCPTACCLRRRQLGQSRGDPRRLGTNPRVELSEGQGAVPLDDGDPQGIGLEPTEGHRLCARRGVIDDALDLAEPVAQHLGDVG